MVKRTSGKVPPASDWENPVAIFITTSPPQRVFLRPTGARQMKKPAPTKITIAPRGKSWHGNHLQNDSTGLVAYPAMTEREQLLAEALERIVLEAMHYSPVPRRMDSDSYLPECLVKQAQYALGTCGMRVEPTQEVVA